MSKNQTDQIASDNVDQKDTERADRQVPEAFASMQTIDHDNNQM